MFNLFDFIGKKIYKFKLAKAIKHANFIRNTSGHKCFVFRWNDKIVVKKKQSVKSMIANKKIKGLNIREFEKKCIYVTN